MEKYILVVDDNPSDLLISSRLIENTERVVVRADRPQQALELLKKYPFSLFVVDLQMPDLPGFEVIKVIRSMEKYKKTPVLVMSARGETKDVVQAVQAGANDFAVKPLDHMVFEGKVNTLMGEEVNWQEYPLTGEVSERQAHVIRNLTLISISEVGMTAEVESKMEIGDIFEVQSPVLKKWNLTFVRVKVNEIFEVEKKFILKLEFIATKETQRQQIRLLCRDLWKHKSPR